MPGRIFWRQARYAPRASSTIGDVNLVSRSIAGTMLLLALSACSLVAEPVRPVEAASPIDVPPVVSRGERIVAIARNQLGSPYLFGGDTPQGFDCSGLVRYVFAAAGIAVPRTAEEQSRAVLTIEPSALQPGDLVFFSTANRGVDHVGIYAGAGQFVHAPSSGRSVTLDALDAEYYRRRLTAAGRLP